MYIDTTYIMRNNMHYHLISPRIDLTSDSSPHLASFCNYFSFFLFYLRHFSGVEVRINQSITKSLHLQMMRNNMHYHLISPICFLSLCLFGFSLISCSICCNR